MSDGEKRVTIAIRLLSAAIVIFVFAGATAIKKPLHNSNDGGKNLFEIAFLTDINKSNSSEAIAKENDDPEVPVTAVPEEKAEEETEEKTEEKVEEKVENNAVETPTNYYSNTKTTTTQTSTPTIEQPVKAASPNNPNNYDAGSPYAGQVYVDGGEAPELHNPTYYEIPGGNPNIVVEEESAPTEELNPVPKDF